jgi:hypothetical protein
MVPGDDDRLETQLDELYGLPLDAFTPARDKLARELRKAGDRAAADRVKALRKPSVVAWALNQVQRHHRERVEQLLLAGEQLREAQSRLLAGAEHGTLRDAVARERALIDELAQLAEQQLALAGHAPSVTVQNKLWQTLQAAARDEQTRSLLSRGRLLKEGQITDLGLGGLGDAVAGDRPAPASAAPVRSDPRPRPGSREQGQADQEPAAERPAVERPAAERPAAERPAARRDPGRERKLKAARERLQRAREQQDAQERELTRLEQTAAQARQQAERAQTAAAHAGEAAERASVKAAQAAERSRELEAALRKLEAEA